MHITGGEALQGETGGNGYEYNDPLSVISPKPISQRRRLAEWIALITRRRTTRCQEGATRWDCGDGSGRPEHRIAVWTRVVFLSWSDWDQVDVELDCLGLGPVKGRRPVEDQALDCRTVLVIRAVPGHVMLASANARRSDHVRDVVADGFGMYRCFSIVSGMKRISNAESVVQNILYENGALSSQIEAEKAKSGPWPRVLYRLNHRPRTAQGPRIQPPSLDAQATQPNTTSNTENGNTLPIAIEFPAISVPTAVHHSGNTTEGDESSSQPKSVLVITQRKQISSTE
ncbi:uncharacterized protein N7482_005933 [Penicillium canariense]|uniref:Uncharacterized protein n=1 Tax=Penicillium canariense TaxID=189055 RepID=A0A9W9I7F3_9EURO|nr:uncharacterized protein N7482_005933 [Penicillium canariense]KAJ5167152.1 hypothetical protein N7482_005933 [Penicillium canariense]